MKYCRDEVRMTFFTEVRVETINSTSLTSFFHRLRVETTLVRRFPLICPRPPAEVYLRDIRKVPPWNYFSILLNY